MIKIHVGLPRTGTTAVQYLLTEKSLPGILYPSQFKDAEGRGHHRLHDMLIEDPRSTRHELFRIAVEAARKGDTIVLSSENLFTNIPAHYSLYDEFFRSLRIATGLPVEFICVTRPLQDFAWSMYLQSMRDLRVPHQGRYIDYWTEAAEQVVTKIRCFIRQSPTYPIHFVRYSPKNMGSEFLRRITGRPESEGSIPPLRSSATGSSLLYGFFYYLRSRKQSLDPKVWWLIVGGDLDGNFFNPSARHFEDLDTEFPKERLRQLAASSDMPLTIEQEQALDHLLSDGHYLPMDFGAPTKSSPDFKLAYAYLDYIRANAAAMDVATSSVDEAEARLSEYQRTFT